VLPLALLGYVVIAKGSLHELPVHPGVGGFYLGPNSETIIKGPDGSVITVEANGGSVQVPPEVKPVLTAEPVLVEPLASTSEVVSVPADTSSAQAAANSTSVDSVAAGLSSATLVASPADQLSSSSAVAAALGSVYPPAVPVEIVQPDPHIIETEIVDALPVEPNQASDLVGPSGRITTSGSSSVISGPASTTISEPTKVILATPTVPAVPILSGRAPLQAAPVVEIVEDIPRPTVPPVLRPAILTATAVPPAQTIGPIVSTTLSPLKEVLSPTLGISSSTSATVNLVEPYNLEPAAIQLVKQPAATIESASSDGFPDNNGPLSIYSTALPPLLRREPIENPSSNSENSLNYAIINNRQLNLNPSLIPANNIIPPEIGHFPSRDTINIGNTVTVSSTSIPVELSGVQSINSNLGTDGSTSQVPASPAQNQIVFGNQPSQ
ncbi:hypothetical protein NQ317_001680, partial [Molorchus minor]